jgi:hypothetical protein
MLIMCIWFVLSNIPAGASEIIVQNVLLLTQVASADFKLLVDRTLAVTCSDGTVPDC